MKDKINKFNTNKKEKNNERNRRKLKRKFKKIIFRNNLTINFIYLYKQIYIQHYLLYRIKEQKSLFENN